MTDGNRWQFGEHEFELGERSLVVGILNVTPDSFSDGGDNVVLGDAVSSGLGMFEYGASLVDIGGESTRPGFTPVTVEDEIARVVPVIQELLVRRPNCILSIDTSKSSVAKAALKAGASVINDIWGLQADQDLAKVAASHSAGLILMRNGRDGRVNGAVVDRVRASWEKSIEIAADAGCPLESIVLDPGLGFGTTRQEDLEILQGLDVLRSFGFPLMLGASRKRITAEPHGLPLEERLEASLATTVVGIAAGVDLFRVHDVAEHARAIGLTDLIYRGGKLSE